MAAAVGAVFTTTVVEAEFVQPLELVTVNVYDPAMVEVAPVMVGLCRLDVNPLGPVQEYELIPPGPPVSWMVWPTQYGPPLEAVAVGAAFTTTMVEAEFAQPLELVAVSVYEPAFVVAAFEIVGFWRLDVNPLGPVQEYELIPPGPPVSWMVWPTQ